MNNTPLSLSYLTIIQSTGVPLYSSSFNFIDDENCRNFNGRLELTNHNLLFGGIFSAICNLSAEIMKDELENINIHLSSYDLFCLTKNNLLFIGVFERVSNQGNDQEISKIILDTMSTIAKCFFKTYPQEEIMQNDFTINRFNGFNEHLTKMNLSISNCRNCLKKCSDKFQCCIPHQIYFEKTLNKDKNTNKEESEK